MPVKRPYQEVVRVELARDFGAPLVHQASVLARVIDQALGAVPAMAVFGTVVACCARGARGR